MTSESPTVPAAVSRAGVILLAVFLPALLLPKLGAVGLLPTLLLAWTVWRRRLPRQAPQASAPATTWRVNALLALGAVIVTLGTVEYGARAAIGLGLVETYRPMRTLVPAGTEDWRLAHITADRHREADPVLLWRPVAGGPYNTQRMKGPLAAIPKPPRTVRVICYGDSNTDGPARGGWPEHLATELQVRVGDTARIEVLNAGVAGYSSHQGLLRFRNQVERFNPDVVLVSFGWNDLATALGPPDRAFEPPPAWRVGLDRFLLDYRIVRVARSIAARRVVTAPATGHRVPLEDYRANLRGFIATARAHGAAPVLLTRPYRLPTEQLRAADGWRSLVPRYNRALLSLAKRRGVLAVDVQAAFEAATDDFEDQCHFSPAGQRRMAALVADALAAAGLLADHPGSETDPAFRSWP